MTTTLFSAADGTHGNELWVTDGTRGGTHLLVDIYSGQTGSYPLYLTSLRDGKAIFAATDATNGKELWITDGTAAGTSLIKDIYAGPPSSFPGEGKYKGDSGFFALGNGKVLFDADDGGSSVGLELWISDGTSAGTHVVKDINPGSAENSYPTDFTALGNGQVLFAADNGTLGTELWVTDGTAAGTNLVKDIYAGFGSSYPSHITALGNGKAIFQATVKGAAPTGNELWVTDGTTAGTTLLLDINPGSGSSDPAGLAVIGGVVALDNGKAVFQADDGTHGTELWVTDGTTAGTKLVKDIYPGVRPSDPSELTLLGIGKAVFAATDDTHGTELWVTDGTAAGTQLVMDIDPGSASGIPSRLTALGNGKVVFSADDSLHGFEVWVTDGTAAGTQMIANIGPGDASSNPYFVTAIGNGEALFDADDGTLGNELWITDGTSAGPHPVDDVYPGAGSSHSAEFTTLAQAYQSPAILDDFGWQQGWGGPDNPRLAADVNGDGNADYVGFGDQSTFIAYGGMFANALGLGGPGFSASVAAVQDFGTAEGYTSSVQRGVAATGVGAGDSIYGQGFAGIYWYAATGATTQQDATGNSYSVPQYQSTPNFYGNFGSQEGWTPSNGFQIVKASTSDSFASILGFGAAGIVVGPQAFAPGATAAAAYVIPLAAGNSFGWNQQVDIRSFTDANGTPIDLNRDGVTDFVGMGPQGLFYALGSESGGTYQLGALQTAQISGTNTDLGEAQGWTDSATLRYIVADPKTGFDDILAFGAPGVFIAIGQDPTAHNGQPFGQLHLAMPDFGSDQGWSVSQTPRIVGDVNGDGVPDIVGFGASNTFVAVGTRDASGDLHFALDPNETIGDFGSSEAWSGTNPQTVRALANFQVNGVSHSDLLLSGAFNTQLWQFS